MAEKDFRVKKGLQVDGTGDSSIAGNLGIGTTSPSSILHVKEASTINSVANSARMIVSANGGDSYIHLMESTDGHNIRHTASDNSLRFRSTLAGSDLMTLTSGGNLGIGTTPSVPFHVAGGNNEAARFEGSANDAFIKILEPTGSENVVLGSTGGTGFVGSASNNNFAIRANNSNKMTITSAGDVGIGITAPSTDLHVAQPGDTSNHYTALTLDNGIDTDGGRGVGMDFRVRFTSGNIHTSQIYFDFYGDKWTDSIGMNYLSGRSGSFSHHHFRDQGGTPQMMIADDGNVGIGSVFTHASQPNTPLASNAKGLVIAGTGGILDNAQDGTERIPTLVLYDTVTDYGSNTATVGEARGSIEFYSSETSNNYPGIAASIKAINESTYNSAMGLGLFTSNNLATATEKVRINADGQLLVGKTTSVASVDRKLEVEGSIAAASGGSGGVGFHMKNSEGEFLIYTDDGHMIVKDYAGSDTYPFKIMGGSQNDTLVVNTGGDVTVKDDLTVNGHINFDTQHVGGSAGGATSTENGANTWCKILEWDHNTTQFRDLSLTLGITEVDVGSQNQAIIAVYGRSHAANSDLTMGVKIISLISASHLRDDSFKIINNGWGTPIQLWMKKYGTYGTFNWNEIAKKVGGSTTLTYSSNSAWQSTEPASTANPVQELRSYGTVIEGRQSVLNLYHNQNVSQLSANDVLSTISFRKHTSHGGNESIRIYNVQGDSGSSGASDDYHTSDLRISTRKIGTNSYTDRFTILGQEGYVGIGTTIPASLLDVSSDSTSVIRLSNTDTALTEDQITGEIVFDQSDSTSGGDGISGRIGMRSAVRPDNSQYFGNVADMGFFVSGAGDGTASNNAALEAMTIRAGGKVGIGTTSPGEKLHVAGGNINLDAGYYYNFRDRSDLGMKESNYSVSIMAPEEVYVQIDSNSNNNNDTFFAIQRDGNAVGGGTELFRVQENGRVGIGTASPASELHVVGHIQATTKSFVIDHPSKEGMTLRHGSLEGPEHAVYVRGQAKGNLIDLPNYWSDLVDEESITVQLTPKYHHQTLYVKSVDSEKVVVGSPKDTTPEFYYLIHAERKDVDKMVVEY